jgi:hypothetical protein
LRNGVYRYSEEESLLKWCPPTSNAVLRILIGITRRLAFKIDPPSDGYLEWYMEQDPCYYYGWPSSSVPAPANASSFGWVRTLWFYEPMGSIFSEKLCTFGRLLALRQADTASIARAIDSCGFWAFDSVGRLEKRTNADHRYKEIQKALSDYHTAVSGEKFPGDEILRNEVFSKCGWLHHRIPVFSDNPEEEQSKVQAHVVGSPPGTSGSNKGVPSNPILAAGPLDKRELDARLRKSYDIVICGLLAMVRGEIAMQSRSVAPPGKGVPKQNQIIEILLDSMSTSGEISDTNIREKFGAANKHRPKFNLPPLRDDG